MLLQLKILWDTQIYLCWIISISPFWTYFVNGKFLLLCNCPAWTCAKRHSKTWIKKHSGHLRGGRICWRGVSEVIDILVCSSPYFNVSNKEIAIRTEHLFPLYRGLRPWEGTLTTSNYKRGCTFSSSEGSRMLRLMFNRPLREK